MQLGGDLLAGGYVGDGYAGGGAGRVRGGVLAAHDDLAEVALFPLEAPPQPLAFPTDLLVLEELRAGKAGLIPDSVF